MTMTRTATIPAGGGSIGAWGNIGRGFAHPVDVAHDPATGRLFVLNRSTSWNSPHGRAVRVTVLDGPDPDAQVVAEFARRGTDAGGLVAPVAIAASGDGRVAVTDEHTHAVSVFTKDGRFLRQIGRPGSDPGHLCHPAGVAADPEGLWVVDAANDRIQRLAWDGTPEAVLGSTGFGPGQFRHPWHLQVDVAGRLWVADWGNDRIQALTAEGRCAIVVGSPDGDPFRRPSAVALGPGGRVYVADWGQRRLQVFNEDWRRVDIWHGDADLSPWARERLAEFPAMADGRQAAADPAGERLLGRPGGMCVLPGGDVLVADPSHHRLQRYRRRPS